MQRDRTKHNRTSEPDGYEPHIHALPPCNAFLGGRKDVPRGDRRLPGRAWQSGCRGCSVRGAGCYDAGEGLLAALLFICGIAVVRILTVRQLEIAELQRQEIDIRQEKEDKEREVADALAPRLASLELSGIPAISYPTPF